MTKVVLFAEMIFGSLVGVLYTGKSQPDQEPRKKIHPKRKSKLEMFRYSSLLSRSTVRLMHSDESFDFKKYHTCGREKWQLLMVAIGDFQSFLGSHKPLKADFQNKRLTKNKQKVPLYSSS